jgi:hypothetical protein
LLCTPGEFDLAEARFRERWIRRRSGWPRLARLNPFQMSFESPAQIT